MGCGSGCCNPASVSTSRQPPSLSALTDAKTDADLCCDTVDSLPSENDGKNICRSIANTKEDTSTLGSSTGGCCGEKKPVSPSQVEPSTANTAGCQEKCCDGSTERSQSCDSSEIKKIEGDTDSNELFDGCQKSCCSSPTQAQLKTPDTPVCCEGKKSPCCDESCLERLALRECESTKPVNKCSSSEGSM